MEKIMLKVIWRYNEKVSYEILLEAKNDFRLSTGVDNILG